MQFNAKQQVFLDLVPSQYVKVGVEELDREKLSPLLRLKYNAIADAVADLASRKTSATFSRASRNICTSRRNSGHQLPELCTLTHPLVSSIVGHFAHEERLMRASRYGSLRWHKQSHDDARRRVGQFVQRIEKGDAEAGHELVAYLTAWLHDHTGLADRIMGAFLRNHQRCMFKLTFQAGTKPLEACTWVRANGDTFDAQTGETGS